MAEFMLQKRSALAQAQPFSREGLAIAEAPGFTLIQLAGDDKTLRKAAGKLPSRVGTLLKTGEATVFRIAPQQIWLLNGEVEDTAGCHVTPLSSGRTRIAVSGTKARAVLATLAPIDVQPTEFKPGQFAMTGIHHTPVMIQCVAPDEFHIYALSTFARAVWEFTLDAAEGVLLQG